MHDEPFNLLGVPPEDWAKTPQTVRLAVLSLLDIVQAQSLQLKQLQAQVQELQVKVGQTSRTSSKPPSSDPPSAPPKPPRSSRGRKAGGQPGHVGQHRPLLPPEQVDEPIELLPEHCPNCLTTFAVELPTLGDPQRTQVWELPVLLPHIIEYRQHTRCCPDCHQFVTAALPPDAPPGAFGPRATALMAVLRGRYRLSLDDASEFLADVCNLPVSTASIVTSCERTSEALAPVDAAIQAVVQAAAIVNADETSWPTQTRKGWLWVAVCAIATCFRVHPSRSGSALRDLLGEAFRGSVGSDRYAAYNQLSDGQRQMCWAHLIRNLLGLHEHYGEQTGWAQQMLNCADDLFLLWHLYKEGWLDQVALQQALLPIRVVMRERLMEGVNSP